MLESSRLSFVTVLIKFAISVTVFTTIFIIVRLMRLKAKLVHGCMFKSIQSRWLVWSITLAVIIKDVMIYLDSDLAMSDHRQ